MNSPNIFWPMIQQLKKGRTTMARHRSQVTVDKKYFELLEANRELVTEVFKDEGAMTCTPEFIKRAAKLSGAFVRLPVEATRAVVPNAEEE